MMWFDQWLLIHTITHESWNQSLKMFKDLRGLWEYIFRRNLEPQTGQFPEKLYSLRGELRSIISPENKEYNFVFCNKISDYTPYFPGKLYSLSPGVKEYNFSWNREFWGMKFGNFGAWNLQFFGSKFCNFWAYKFPILEHPGFSRFFFFRISNIIHLELDCSDCWNV